jgi:hypothetical protein
MSTFDPSMLIPDNDPETIWKELKLGDLLEDSKKSMLDTLFYKRQLESIHQPAIVKHEKMLKKPGFNVLMDRYQSNPTDPIVCPKNKLDKLADPLRGKYSHFDDILSDEQKFDVALKERDQSSSQKSVTKSIRSPLKKAGVSPTRSLGDGVGGFFLTATGVDDDDNDNVYVSKNYDKRSENLANMEDHVLSRVRRRLEEAAKIESYIADPIDGKFYVGTLLFNLKLRLLPICINITFPTSAQVGEEAAKTRSIRMHLQRVVQKLLVEARPPHDQRIKRNPYLRTHRRNRVRRGKTHLQRSTQKARRWRKVEMVVVPYLLVEIRSPMFQSVQTREREGRVKRGGL